MTSKLGQSWIPHENIERLVQLEPALVFIGLSFGAWAVYRLFLKKLSDERHRNLRAHFKNLGLHLLGCLTLLSAYVASQKIATDLPGVGPLLSLIGPYFGFATLLSGVIVFVKVCRIWVLIYLFLGHMRVAVPLLLVNLFTLLLTVILCGWLITEVFQVRLAPVLATSAIFSLIVGMATQDTLGNLFAGIALQIDKPYEIGDWIEVQSNAQKWVGQINEISWRATVLTGLTEETITIPNRVIAQAQVSNFSRKNGCIIRSAVFRLPFDIALDPAKKVLIEAALRAEGVQHDPRPLVFGYRNDGVVDRGQARLLYPRLRRAVCHWRPSPKQCASGSSSPRICSRFCTSRDCAGSCNLRGRSHLRIRKKISPKIPQRNRPPLSFSIGTCRAFAPGGK